jgi:hypothetical protein
MQKTSGKRSDSGSRQGLKIKDVPGADKEQMKKKQKVSKVPGNKKVPTAVRTPLGASCFLCNT